MESKWIDYVCPQARQWKTATMRLPNFCPPDLRRFYRTGRNAGDIAREVVRNSAVEERRNRAKLQKIHFREIARRLKISVRLLRRVVYHLPELFLEELVIHGAVAIPKIGTLKLRRFKRTHWNSVIRGKVGGSSQRANIVKPAMIRAHFKPAKALKATIERCMEEGLIANDLLSDMRQKLSGGKWRDDSVTRLMRYNRYRIMESNRACPEEEAERRLRHPPCD